MASKEQAYNEGYKRGLEGAWSPSSCDGIIGDATVNESGSGQARTDGYYAGQRDRMRIEAERRNNS